MRTVVALPLAAILAGGVLLTAPAGAATPAPAVPRGMRVAAVTGTSLTITLPRVRNATEYGVYASTVRSDVYADHYLHPSRAQRHATSASPRITVTGLPYSTSPVWWRVVALRGRTARMADAITSVALRPAAPSTLTARSGHAGTALAWSARPALGARIEQATDSRFTTGRHTYAVRGTTHRFTPFGLTPGRRYWFRVRSANGATVSATGRAVSIVAAERIRTLRVMTYNLLAAVYDGTSEGGQKVAPWSVRSLAAAALVEQAMPDVLAVQEGWPPGVARQPRTPCTDDPHSYHWPGAAGSPYRYLQVDSLCDALGGRYRRSDDTTGAGGVHPGQGNYLLYDPRTVRPLGRGGFWNLGPGGVGDPTHRTSAYQAFTVLATGARVLVASAHLVADAGRSFDVVRARQAATLLARSSAYARSIGVTSVVLAGDMNSYPGRVGAVDTPGDALRAHGLADALEVAQSVRGNSYSSVNDYAREPARHGGSVDHVYVTPGVGVRSWTQLLRLAHGRFAGTIPSDHNPVYVDLTLPY